jgi:hypothetical protein
MYSLSGGRWLARKRATSDPTPMNQSNKESPTQEGVTAEVGEGRAWTKENISQGRTIPTQCGLFVVSQELIGMRQINLALFIQGRSRMR